MAMYTIRIIKGGRTVLRRQVSEGLGRDAVVIQAQADVTYLLGDALDNTGPSKIAAKRIGKNLHLAIGKGNPDVPDLIIEGYFDFAPASIAGNRPDGGQAVYDLGTLSASAANSTAASNPSNTLEKQTAQASLPSEGMDTTTKILAGLGGALVLGSLGGGGGGGSGGADTVALSRVTDFAADGTKPAPTVTDYSDIGIRGVTSANLASINSAVDILDGSKVDNRANVQIVVDAYTRILAEANGNSPDATPANNPSDSDYAAIGANIGLAATNAVALGLLNEVVGNLTTTAIDTVAEINAIATVIDKVMNTAAGVPSPLSVADFALLGLPTTGAGAVTSLNLSAVNNAISTAGGQTRVDSYAELSGLVSAVATIVSYANDSTQVAPTVAQYASAGITGVTAANLVAINSAVDANTATGVDTNAKLQPIVDTYNLILAEANGAAADTTPGTNPTAAQFALIGANIGLAASNPVALGLLNNVMANLPSTAIDTVAEINALAAVVDKVINTAADVPTALSVADFALLGLPTAGAGAVTAVNLSAVNNAIATAGGQTRVDTFVELGSLVSAVATIASFADDNTLPAPTLLQYTTAGITGVTAANLAAVNSAVDANSTAGVDTKAELQAIVNAYSLILAEANGAGPDATPGVNPTADLFALIGANIGAAASSAANLSLLNEAIGVRTSTAVDTVAEINDLAVAANAVMTGAAGGAAPTIQQLSLLGVGGVNATNIAAVQAAIAATTDDGLQVDTVAELQALVPPPPSATLKSQVLILDDNLAARALALMDSASENLVALAAATAIEANALGTGDRAVSSTASTIASGDTHATDPYALDTPDTGSSVHTILALQAIVNAHTL